MAASYSRRVFMAGVAGLGGVALAPAASAFAANPVSPLPKTNQVGFPRSGPKRFCLAGTKPASGDDFVLETLGGAAVFHGTMGAWTDRRPLCGEYVRAGDFSGWTTPGTYRVATGGQKSYPFIIGDGVCRSLLHDAARAFYLIRANVAIDDPATGLRHGAAHLSEATLSVAGETRDLTGGWYNAGDFGKWTHMAAISVSHMLWLCELRPDAAKISLDVPNDTGLPDLLAQARWGLEWLFKMQNADGSVLHKVDSEPNLPWGILPDADRNVRTARGPWSKDAGVFVGVMAQAARVLPPFDAALAARCRAAAVKSWNWLDIHPDIDGRDPYYRGDAIWPKTAWALCSMAALTGDPALIARAGEVLCARGVVPSFWMFPQILGAFALARSGASRSQAVAAEQITIAADRVAAACAGDPYGFSANSGAYVWGSAENALDAANACFFAYEIGKNPAHRACAERLFDYVLGCNALGRSFVTGHGTDRIVRPYHWACRAADVVIPGWAVGGPNRYRQGADPLLLKRINAGAPPAKCHVDACEANGSWASNEGQTSENAALILAAGLYEL